MAAEIDATLSGPNSNSYITQAEAQSYFDARLHAASWTSALDAEKIQALIMACRHIESCRLRVDRRVSTIFSPASSDQALSFPRLRDVDASGAYIIPPQVTDAQCEEALALLAFGAEQERRAALQAGGVTSFSTDGLSEGYGTGAPSHPLASARARILLGPYIQRGGVIATSDVPAGEFTPASGR